MTGYTYSTTDGKQYKVIFGEGQSTADCKTIEITPPQIWIAPFYRDRFYKKLTDKLQEDVKLDYQREDGK